MEELPGEQYVAYVEQTYVYDSSEPTNFGDVILSQNLNPSAVDSAAARALQRQLNEVLAAFPGAHEPLDPDGKYGALTATAVRAFQMHMGLPETGVVGRGDHSLVACHLCRTGWHGILATAEV